MINKYLLILIAINGILVGNNWIIASIVPALAVNFVVYILIKYAERTYHPIYRKELLVKDLQELNDDILMNIVVVVAKLSLTASTLYLLWLLYSKFFGTFS